MLHRLLAPRALIAPTLVLTFLAAACHPSGTDAGAARAGGGAGLVFENADAPRPYFHDFGERLYGETIAHTWRLANREGRALVLRDLLPDCGCTLPRAAVILPGGERVEAPVETRGMAFEIPDGATLEVRIAIDTLRVERPNQHKLAQVRLRCDSDVTPYVTFEMHVLVRRAFRSTPAEGVLANVPQSAGKSVRLDVTTELAGDASRIRGVERVEGPFRAELTATEFGAERLWILVVTVDPGLTLGAHAGRVVLGTTHDDGQGVGPDFEVPVRAVVVEDCVIEPRVIAIPRESGASTTAFLHALAPGARVGVRGARLDGGASELLRARVEPEAPDDEGRAARWRITISAAAELPAGGFTGRLVVDLDDPLLPSVEAPYAAPPR